MAATKHKTCDSKTDVRAPCAVGTDNGTYNGTYNGSVEKMADVEISVVGENLRAKLGEGPHWDTKTQRLFWVDCFDCSVHVLDVETGKVKVYVRKLVESVTSAICCAFFTLFFAD